MLADRPRVFSRIRIVSVVLAMLLLGHPTQGQGPAASGGAPRISTWTFRDDPVLVKVRVLDASGLPLNSVSQVRIFSTAKAKDAKPLDLAANTQENSIAEFKSVRPGDYELEVSSTGLKKASQHLHVMNWGENFSVFVYLHSELEPDMWHAAKFAAPMSLKSLEEIDKGLDFFRTKQYDKASRQLAEASRHMSENPDVWCWLGTAELRLQRMDAARKAFEKALSLEPAHENAMLGLAEVLAEKGETSAAIILIERAAREYGAGWRTYYLLGVADAHANRLSEAKAEGIHSLELAEREATPDAGYPLLLLGEIQYLEGKKAEARQTWQSVVIKYPTSAAATEATKKYVKTIGEAPELSDPVSPKSSTPSHPDQATAPPEDELPWAPPQIDAREFPTASNVTCKADEVLDIAEKRLNAQLLNFEKFTATEHIIHQEIELTGVPDLPKEKQFSYIVFVIPYAGDSLYLEESRDGGPNLAAFPTAMITTGLTSLGVALLQPVNRDGFIYTCEGLTSVRGQAAWQIRFEEKKDTSKNIRRWRNNNVTYNIRVKGRLWLASASYDMLRIETDLLEPVQGLGLTRDHLQVDYGPVSFLDGKQWLWLPWSADMYMEWRHKRFHHQHSLSDYMLFGVDTTDKVTAPKAPPEPEEPKP